MADNKNLLGLLALAVGGYFVYKWWEKQHPPLGVLQPPIEATATPSTLVSPTNVPTSGTVAPPPVTNTTGPPPITTQQAVTAGIDPVVYGVVQKWAQTDGRAPVLAMAAAGIAQEYAGMYDIITNYWDKNVNPIPQPQVTFWDNLRAKYDPTHIYW